MARIFYSVSGEGRGHATRVRAVVEGLRRTHEVTILAFGDAVDLLTPLFAGADNVEVVEIPGPRFVYNRKRRLSYWKTAWKGAGYALRLPGLLRRIERMIEEKQPALAVTDFEPALPRAARRIGLPFISVDHQHFLNSYDFSELPGRLRRKARWMGRFVGLYYRGQRESVVSSFYDAPLRRDVKNVVKIGTLLGPEVLAAKPVAGEHLVAYIRRETSPRLVRSLADCGREVRIYGLGERPRTGGAIFKPVAVQGFIDDLASACGLVTTAGNQLVGEALYLRKPVLAIPEIGNFEQEINAHYLSKSGGGTAIDADSLDAGRVREFIAALPSYCKHIDPDAVRGNEQAIEAIERHVRRGEVVRESEAITGAVAS